MSPSPHLDDRIIARRRVVGERIRQARIRANLSQESVGLRSGIDRASYNRIEQGHASPLLDTLFRIADAIGVSTSELVREDSTPHS
ncbi:helix-turn-helix transcriptional regulator [Streptomyces sp. SID3212]|uniref:helix-turn-helix domain-containing protein n=1 Tax=Streptomyces sp. SID3212 TaxID=2690259 RepID=UPI001371987A|nr:helix-turn-helix domain-containing protein [Streptomyces sp. SID3212]